LIVFAGLQLYCNSFRISQSIFGRKTAVRNLIAPVFEDSDENTGITLGRFMVETVAANSEDRKLRELEELIMSIQTACKTIASVVDRASITGKLGLEAGGGSINIQGEEQKRLDVITNEIFKKALRFSGTVAVLASEEETNPMSISTSLVDKYRDVGLITTQFKGDVLIQKSDLGKYVAVFDPLDGSSNVYIQFFYLINLKII
jgi:fructose-1,6-bisphosphatase I